MVVLLVCDIFFNVFNGSWAYAEGRIPGLPSESSLALCYPNRRCFLNFTYNVRDRMCGFEAGEAMNVIGNSANC